MTSEVSPYPSLEISCRTCARNRGTPVCIGTATHCRVHGKQTNGSWLPGQPRPDEPCRDYRPSAGSVAGAILAWSQAK